jgi:hypothetical protein
MIWNRDSVFAQSVAAILAFTLPPVLSVGRVVYQGGDLCHGLRFRKAEHQKSYSRFIMMAACLVFGFNLGAVPSLFFFQTLFNIFDIMWHYVRAHNN